MPDLDDLLGGDLAGAAARAVRPPDFEAVVARGQRLRRRRRAAVAAAVCVLAVLASLGTVLGRTASSSAPAPAGPQPVPHHVRPPAPEAVKVVDSPRASVAALAVSPADPDVRAVLWQLCTGRCGRRQAALALTADGFRSRTLVAVRDGHYPMLSPAGDRTFLVSNDRRHPYLLDVDGTRRAVTPPAAPAAVAPGEVVARWDGARGSFVAVDPQTATSHRVTVPAGTSEVLLDGPGHLRALQDVVPARTPTVAWSDDGGLSWRTHFLGSTERGIFKLVPSAAPGTTAVLVGSDGATLFPFEGVQRGSRDGASWQAFPQPSPPSSFVDIGSVLPDGRLLVSLMSAKEPFRPGTGSGPRHGLYVSAGADWSRFTPLVPGSGLSARDRRWMTGADLHVLGESVRPDGATVYVGEGSARRVWAVEDGRVWTETRMR